MKAIVFDVDGTLYDARPVRNAMLRRLLLECCRSPKNGVATVRLLRQYRHAHEGLRHRAGQDDLAEAQLMAAVNAEKVPREWAAATVERWMEQYPLEAIRIHAKPGLIEFLDWAEGASLPVGVLSDYPCNLKLAALGIERRVRVIVSAQDKAVQRLKPDPRGLQLVARRLNLSVSDLMYVGDRPEVDCEAARRAGAEFVLIGKSSRPGMSVVPDFGTLQKLCESRITVTACGNYP
jgi:FMN phosphatase YigB (HAD superfamily)